MNKNYEIREIKDLNCKNNRCITTTEKYLKKLFYVVNEEKGEFRCRYCDCIVRK